MVVEDQPLVWASRILFNSVNVKQGTLNFKPRWASDSKVHRNTLPAQNFA